MEYEDGDLQKAIVNTLIKHHTMTGPEVHTFVAIYSKPGEKISRRKLAKQLDLDRKTITLAIERLESRGLIKCFNHLITPVNILKGL